MFIRTGKNQVGFSWFEKSFSKILMVNPNVRFSNLKSNNENVIFYFFNFKNNYLRTSWIQFEYFDKLLIEKIAYFLLMNKKTFHMTFNLIFSLLQTWS